MKISITNLLERRKKLNVMLLVAVLCLSAFMLSIATTKNPGGTKAAAPSFDAATNTWTISQTLNIGELTTYDNSNLIIGAPAGTATVTVAGHHSFKSLTIQKGGLLTHADFVVGELAATSTKKIDLKIEGDLILDGGYIEAGMGYAGGGAGQNGEGPGGGGRAQQDLAERKKYAVAGGGSFVRKGQDGEGGGVSKVVIGLAGSVYSQAPVSPGIPPAYLQAGSGGGGADTFESEASGGAGGGRITLDITGKLRMINPSSSIKAVGGSSSCISGCTTQYAAGGGGSGGAVWIKASTITYVYSTGYHLTKNMNVSQSAPPILAGPLTDNDLFNVYAYAGYGDWVKGNTLWGGAGGGGYIYVQVDNPPENECYISTGYNSIPAACENQDVIIDGATVTTSGSHNYASLKIMNGAVLTHDPIQVADIDTIKSATDPNYLNANGKNKKVDLSIDGDLILDGGSIDVSEKGYPGGTIGSLSENGYGPGGGQGDSNGSDHAGGAGGSFAGKGGNGANGKVPGPVYEYNAFLPVGQIQAGSGGGAARSYDSGGSACTDYGGRGGGRIQITAIKISLSHGGFMAANGQDGDTTGRSGCESPSGGGSGGAILLYFNQYQLVDSGFEPHVLGGSYINIGGDGKVVSGTDVYNLKANGGIYDLRKHDVYGGSGSGGWIVINPMPPSQSVKKVLIPLDRPGASDDGNALTAAYQHDNFNPYSLQMGDKIKVKLEVYNLVPNSTATVTDMVMKSAEGFGCKSAGDRSYEALVVNDDGKNLTWSGLPTGPNGVISGLYYNCTVEDIEGVDAPSL